MPTLTMATTTAAANSADITVVAGTPINVGLYTDAGGDIGAANVTANISRKNPNATYTLTGMTLGYYAPNIVLDGPGVYRVEKSASAIAVGVVTD